MSVAIRDAETRRDVGGTAVVRSVGLTRTYRSGPALVTAVRGVELSIRRGQLVVLLGRSGSGKSTLLHLIGGLDRPDAGDVLIEGRSLAELPDVELALLRRRRLGFVLQFFNLLPTLTALENAAFPLLLDGIAGATERAAGALARVGLADRAYHLPAELSGGEQQRVAVARALATRPALILADEPTGNLDSETGAGVLAMLRAAADSGETVLMATHDPQARDYADEVLRMVDGTVRSAGGVPA